MVVVLGGGGGGYLYTRVDRAFRSHDSISLIGRGLSAQIGGFKVHNFTMESAFKCVIVLNSCPF